MSTYSVSSAHQSLSRISSIFQSPEFNKVSDEEKEKIAIPFLKEIQTVIKQSALLSRDEKIKRVEYLEKLFKQISISPALKRLAGNFNHPKSLIFKIKNLWGLHLKQLLGELDEKEELSLKKGLKLVKSCFVYAATQEKKEERRPLFDKGIYLLNHLLQRENRFFLAPLQVVKKISFLSETFLSDETNPLLIHLKVVEEDNKKTNQLCHTLVLRATSHFFDCVLCNLFYKEESPYEVDYKDFKSFYDLALHGKTELASKNFQEMAQLLSFLFRIGSKQKLQKLCIEKINASQNFFTLYFCRSLIGVAFKNGEPTPLLQFLSENKVIFQEIGEIDITAFNSLPELEFKKIAEFFPKAVHLKLKFDAGLIHSIWNDLRTQLFNFREFSIEFCSQEESTIELLRKAYLGFDKSHFPEVSFHLKGLKYLSHSSLMQIGQASGESIISANFEGSNLKDHEMKEALPLFKNLKDLTLAKCISIGAESIGAIKDNLRKLQKLSLEAPGSYKLNDQDLISILQTNPSIVELNLNWQTNITSAALFKIAETLPDLISLDIRHLSRVNLDSILEVALNCKSLTQILMDFCAPTNATSKNEVAKFETYLTIIAKQRKLKRLSFVGILNRCYQFSAALLQEISEARKERLDMEILPDYLGKTENERKIRALQYPKIIFSSSALIFSKHKV